MADVLRVAVETLRTLKTVVCPTYGPDGIDIALRTDSGSILVTNSGICILESLSMAHPIGLLLSEQVKRHVGITGDGSKEMIILLSVFLESVDNKKSSLRNLFNSTAINSGLALACAQLNNSIKDKLVGNLEKHCCEIHLRDGLFNQERFYSTCKNVLKTTLNGKFSPTIVEILVEKTAELVFKGKKDQSHLPEHVNQLIDNFQDICITTYGIDITNTRVIDGLVLKQFPIENNEIVNQRKFVLMGDIFDTSTIKFGEVSAALNKANTTSFIKSKLSTFGKVFRVLEEKGINLILLSCKVPDFVKTLCKGRFNVLQSLQDEDIKRISRYFSISPIESVAEILLEDCSAKIGLLSHADELVVGTQRYCWLHPDTSCKDSHQAPFQLLLFAQHQAIGQQYFDAILRMLKVIKMCFYCEYGRQDNQEKNNSVFKCVPGAGFSEANIYQFLQNQARDTSDDSMEIISESLGSAYLEILRLLNRNGQQPHQSHIDIIHRGLGVLHQPQVEKSAMSVVDKTNGEIHYHHQIDTIEPFSSKILLLSHVLQVAQQILRIEQILPSTKPRCSAKKTFIKSE